MHGIKIAALNIFLCVQLKMIAYGEFRKIDSNEKQIVIASLLSDGEEIYWKKERENFYKIY